MACFRWGLKLLVCLWLVVLACSEVRAQTYADEGLAYDACNQNGAQWVAVNPSGRRNPVCTKNGNAYDLSGESLIGPGQWSVSNLGKYYFTAGCVVRADEYGWMPPGGTVGEVVCHNGCAYGYVLDASGNFYSPTGAVCRTADVPPPSIDTDGDGVPDEDDAFPNDPNESADSDGDGIGDNADFSPNDPTDGADEPGEEDGDDEGDNTASGGGDCKAPPSCKGDGIQCNQLFQQWQIRCSGATVTGDPTNCSAGYSCSGDSVQCASVALLRKTACSVSDDGGTGGTPGDANGNGVADVLEGSGSGDTGDPGESDNVTRFGIGVDASLLDQENIFGGGSCPAPPSLTIMGNTISGSDFPYWCQAMAILRSLILIFGAFTAVKILTGWGFS